MGDDYEIIVNFLGLDNGCVVMEKTVLTLGAIETNMKGIAS